MLAPEGVLVYLATENISFQVDGPATYEQMTTSMRRSRAGLQAVRAWFKIG